jgi:nucleotide-binding universal stress UspA family protein
MDTMSEQGSIVVGFDGSSSSTVALEWAARCAVRRNRRLLVVHAAGDPARSSITLGTTETRRVLLQAGRRVAEQGAAEVRRVAPTLEAEVSTLLEDPRQALLELSESASLVVVGTRGHGRVHRLLLGSVSTAVSEYATSPVAVVRPTPAGPPGGVVAGLDSGRTSAAALDMAFELASTEGLPLDVVHSWAEVDLFVDRLSQDQRLEHADAHERLVAELVAGYAEKYPDVTVTSHTPDGNPVQVLLDMSHRASVVVVGSRGLTGLQAALSSVSRDVTARAACTVVVARG